ncbi:hypothetical protein NFI96_032668, partial [Prochilodus magdalenae]
MAHAETFSLPLWLKRLRSYRTEMRWAGFLGSSSVEQRRSVSAPARAEHQQRGLPALTTRLPRLTIGASWSDRARLISQAAVSLGKRREITNERSVWSEGLTLCRTLCDKWKCLISALDCGADRWLWPDLGLMLLEACASNWHHRWDLELRRTRDPFTSDRQTLDHGERTRDNIACQNDALLLNTAAGEQLLSAAECLEQQAVPTGVKMRKFAYCKVVLATSLVWVMLDMFILLYFSECNKCDEKKERGLPGRD